MQRVRPIVLPALRYVAFQNDTINQKYNCSVDRGHKEDKHHVYLLQRFREKKHKI
ncbi:MAG: hypothetical protein LBG15_09175 [Dysgonamonadaceae bacterium]|nr:hypothetical protein [Dysgonamonadaceae bacterium]